MGVGGGELHFLTASELCQIDDERKVMGKHKKSLKTPDLVKY